LDLYVAELAVGYETYLNEKGKRGETLNASQGYTTEELQGMLNSVKKR